MIVEKNIKEKTKFELDKYTEYRFQVVNDKDGIILGYTGLTPLLEFLKTNPVTRKKITCNEYKSYKDLWSCDFDVYDGFYYLANGYRVALEMEIYHRIDNAKKTFYYYPCIEEALPYPDFPNEYIETMSPACEIFIILFKRLYQIYKDDNRENSQGYILSVKEWGMQKVGESVIYDLDGFSWECVADN